MVTTCLVQFCIQNVQGVLVGFDAHRSTLDMRPCDSKVAPLTIHLDRRIFVLDAMPGWMARRIPLGMVPRT